MVNKAIVIGNLGKDPEIRSLQSGGKVASFSVATSERWKDKATGERKERTEWHNIVVFNEGLVGVVESYLKKGSKVYVEGMMQTRKWQDKNGVDRYTTEIVLKQFRGEIQLLDGRGEGGSNRPPAASPDDYAGKARASETFSETVDDEIPF